METKGSYLKNGVEIEYVSIPAGTFMMGSPEDEVGRFDEEGPQHSVTLSEFKMSKYVVTFNQYDAFCDATGRKKPHDDFMGRGNQPVINVNWNDATACAEWLGCRLPTEAEWEYACRAGIVGPFHTGSCLDTDQANYNGNHPNSGCSKGIYLQKVLPVGSYAPNAWGLYEMHGNVLEWCSDRYGKYSSGAKTNPEGQSKGASRVLRGGAYTFGARMCRSATRLSDKPSVSSDYIGFRLVVPN